jgi:hypothetical protein
MVLAISRPFKHPRTGVYWFRKRVPAGLVSVLGRREVTESLGTRDPVEAKQKFAELLRDHEVQWARRGRCQQDSFRRLLSAEGRAKQAPWPVSSRSCPAVSSCAKAVSPISNLGPLRLGLRRQFVIAGSLHRHSTLNGRRRMRCETAYEDSIADLKGHQISPSSSAPP